MEKKINKNFNPGIFNRLYLIRKGIYKGIEKYAPALTGKLMDFGCGEKPYRSLFSHVSEYIGVDYQGDGHDHRNEQIDVFYDGKTIPFPDNTFDSVLSTEVFEHVFNPEGILQELYRVIKPKGKLLITCPFVWVLHEEPVDYARYTPYALQHLLEKNGFRIISMEKAGNHLETIAQLRIIMGLNKLIYNRTTRALLFGKVLFRLFFLYNNIKAVVKTKIGFLYHKQDDLYLSNIVLAEKV